MKRIATAHEPQRVAPNYSNFDDIIKQLDNIRSQLNTEIRMSDSDWVEDKLQRAVRGVSNAIWFIRQSEYEPEGWIGPAYEE